MLNVGGGELVVIALIALIALGPEQLPTVMRKVGAVTAQLRALTHGLKDEFLSGLEQPPTGNGQPPRTTFDPDRPIVPRGYAEQRRAESSGSDDGGTDGDGEVPARAAEAETSQAGHDPDSAS